MLFVTLKLFLLLFFFLFHMTTFFSPTHTHTHTQHSILILNEGHVGKEKNFLNQYYRVHEVLCILLRGDERGDCRTSTAQCEKPLQSVSLSTHTHTHIQTHDDEKIVHLYLFHAKHDGRPFPSFNISFACLLACLPACMVE